MANAMLEDNFKSSHPDLVACGEENDESMSRRSKEARMTDDTSGGDRIVADDHDQRGKRKQQPPDHPHEPSPLLDPTAMPNSPTLSGIQRQNINKDMDDKDQRKGQSSPRKSVDFSLDDTDEPANKKVKAAPLWTPKQVVDAISTCISQHERLEAIQRARDTFDHTIQSLHDEEMATGADAALAKHLTYVTYQAEKLKKRKDNTSSQQSNAGNSFTSNDDREERSIMSELSMTCDAMESLYRASSDIVGASFKRMGEDVMEILVNLINEEINRRFEFVMCADEAEENGIDREEEAAIVMVSTKASPETGGATVNEEQGRDIKADDDTAPVDNKAPEPLSTAPSADSFDEGVQSSGLENDPLMDEEGPSPPASDNSETMQDAESALPAIGSDVATRVRPGTHEGDVILRMATKIIGHFARVGENTKAIAHFRGMLGSLIRLITVQPYDCIPWEARLSALWTIANLACNADNMQMIVCFPDLISALVEISCRPLHPGDDLETIMEVLRSRSIASRAILNLSWSPENKIILAECTAVIDMLSELSVHRSAPLLRSRTVREVVLNTRRHAVAALRNLAAAPRRTKIALCEYKNGHLLDVLTDAALNDEDEVVKEKAFAAIHNLAIHDTAQQIVNHPALVLALKDVLLSDSDSNTPKSHASATLLVLERTITPEMDSYENLRNLIDAINPAEPSGTDDNDNASDSEMEVSNVTSV